MLSVRFGHFFLLTFLHYTNGERRLVDGEDVKINKPYMVYLVQGRTSTRNYDSWICGGAIVHRHLILTSAACVEDVENLYAIAGTEKYVKTDELDKDPCTEVSRRRVIYICVPAAYDLKYEKVSKWSSDDVAMVKVERPYLGEEDWQQCSYTPLQVAVNFEPKYEQPGTDAIVLGWGHSRQWRLTNMTENFNQRHLQYASVSILDTEDCKNYFTDPDMAKQIEDKMICTLHDGKVDETGKPIGARKYYSDGDDESQVSEKPKFEIINGTQITNQEEFQKFLVSPPKTETRRKGICQNDHGGPMVTWINGTEHVIGIASVFRVDQHSNCVGPFLYTSTAKNKPFIECIFKNMASESDKARRSPVCDRTANGQELVILRRYVKWTADHRDSMAPSRNVRLRPQIPISHYRNRNARK